VGHIYNDASIHYSISFTSPKGEGFQPSPRETLNTSRSDKESSCKNKKLV